MLLLLLLLLILLLSLLLLILLLLLLLLQAFATRTKVNHKGESRAWNTVPGTIAVNKRREILVYHRKVQVRERYERQLEYYSTWMVQLS